MSSWRGRGKGRAGAQPQLTFQGGPGKRVWSSRCSTTDSTSDG